jgi:hypothetical protein
VKFEYFEGSYKEGQTSFDKAWKNKTNQKNFVDLLGVVDPEIESYRVYSAGSSIGNKIIRAICIHLHSKGSFKIASLASYKILELVDQIKNVGKVSAKWLYEYYALHATPVVSEPSEITQCKSEAKEPKQVRLFGDKIKVFHIFIIDGVTCFYVEGIIISFLEILEIRQYEDGVIQIDYCKGVGEEGITSENCYTCTVNMCDIDEEEKNKFIAIFQCF